MVWSIGDAELVAMHLSNEDKRVFVQYAMTMLSVQRFEMALKQYASLRTENPKISPTSRRGKPSKKSSGRRYVHSRIG